MEVMTTKEFVRDSRRNGRYRIGRTSSDMRSVCGYVDQTSGGVRRLKFSHMEVVVDDATTVCVDFD